MVVLLIKSNTFLVIATIYTFILDSGNGLLPIPLREFLFGLLLVKTLMLMFKTKIKFPYLKPFMLIGILVPIYGAVISVFRGGNLTYIFDDAKGYIFFLTGLCLSYMTCINNNLKTKIIKHFLSASVIVSLATITFLLLATTGAQGIFESSQWLIDRNLGFAGVETNGQYRIFMSGQLYVMLSLILVFSQMMNGQKNKMNLILFIIFSACILISNTRGLWLGSVIGLGFVFIYSKLSIKKLVTIYIGTILIFSSLFFFQDYIETVTERFSSSFDFSNDASNSTRSEQTDQLLTEFYNYPLIGKGFGATLSSGYTRAEIPYTFELSYFELLYKLGVVGFSFFALGILFIFKLLISTNNKKIKNGLIAAFLSFIVLSTTNPYIVSSLGMFFLAILVSLSTNAKSKEIPVN
jgi:O-Antigen ligase